MGNMTKTELRDQIAELWASLAKTERQRLAANAEAEGRAERLSEQLGINAELRDRLTEKDQQAGLLRMSLAALHAENTKLRELVTEFGDELGSALLLRHYPDLVAKAMATLEPERDGE